MVSSLKTILISPLPLPLQSIFLSFLSRSCCGGCDFPRVIKAVLRGSCIHGIQWSRMWPRALLSQTSCAEQGWHEVASFFFFSSRVGQTFLQSMTVYHPHLPVKPSRSVCPNVHWDHGITGTPVPSCPHSVPSCSSLLWNQPCWQHFCYRNKQMHQISTFHYTHSYLLTLHTTGCEASLFKDLSRMY